MRDVPITVDGITMKPAADVIVHSAGSHFAQRKQNHFSRVFAVITFGIAPIKAREEVNSHWARKFWRVTKTAFLRVVAAVDLFVGSIQNCAVYFAFTWCGRLRRPQRLNDLA